MAISKVLIATIIVSLLVLHLVEAHESTTSTKESQTQSTYVPKSGCKEACARRCRLASRVKMCERACRTCCHRCSCVPPGTSGNQALCPCYDMMTTHHGEFLGSRKCP